MITPARIIDPANAEETEQRYRHIPCYLCQGYGTRAHDYADQEWDERCTACNGKGTIVVEVSPSIGEATK